MTDQEEMFNSIREQFPQRKKRTRPPRDPNKPNLAETLGALFQNNGRDFTGVGTLQNHEYDSGADTQLPYTKDERTRPLPESQRTPPPPVSSTERSRRNVAIPLASPAGNIATSGINKLETNLNSGSSSGGSNVGSNVRVPKDARIVIGFGAGKGINAGVVNGRTVLTSGEGDVLPATNEAGQPNRVADTKMTVETANRILNQDRETTARYQDTKWAETLSTDFQDDETRGALKTVLEDMGYHLSNNRKLSEAQRISQALSDYETDNGLPQHGVSGARFSPDTIKAIKGDIEVMHRLQQDLLK